MSVCLPSIVDVVWCTMADAFTLRMAVRIQAYYRAAKERAALNEVKANVAIVSTEAFGELIGRNDFIYCIYDLEAQKRRLQEKIVKLEHNMYYAEASRQKEIRRVGKEVRKKIREIDKEIKMLMEPPSKKKEGGASWGAMDVAGHVLQVNAERKEAERLRLESAKKTEAMSRAQERVERRRKRGYATLGKRESDVDSQVAGEAGEAVEGGGGVEEAAAERPATAASDSEPPPPDQQADNAARKAGRLSHDVSGGVPEVDPGGGHLHTYMHACTHVHTLSHTHMRTCIRTCVQVDVPEVDPVEAMAFWNAMSSVWNDLPHEILVRTATSTHACMSSVWNDLPHEILVRTAHTLHDRLPRSPLPLTAHHSPLTTHHLPLTAHHSPMTAAQ